MHSKSTGFLSWLRIILELAKAKISIAVTFSVAAGYLIFAGAFTLELLLSLAGVFSLACGSAALNQIQEARTDARMTRTSARPIPSGRIGRDWALFVALAFVGAGFYLLASIERHTLTLMGLGLLTIVWYNGVYFVLKRITAFAVVPGALIGAIPPVIGWVSAGGLPSDPAVLWLAFFFFIWQIPHFWLLLIMFGREYEKAGLPSLTRTFTAPQLARITCVWILALTVVGLLTGATRTVHLPWNLGIIVTSLWLGLKALGILKTGKAASSTFPLFMRINTYLLLVIAFLVGNAFW